MNHDRPRRPERARPSEPPHPASITCREVAAFLLEYADGALPARERAEFDRHVEVCPPCVTYIESYTRTVHLERAALCGPSDEIPPDVPEALVRAILAARASAPRAAKTARASKATTARKSARPKKAKSPKKKRRSG